MKRISMAFFVTGAILGIAPRAYGTCPEGQVLSCTENGAEGTRECLDGYWTECLFDPVVGRVTAEYQVLSVIYAPPGSAGHGVSSVSYGSGSSTGTTTSTSSSFKDEFSVSFGPKSGVVGLGGSFSYGHTSLDSSSVQIKKASSFTIFESGPAVDGIDHDRDQIWLILSPVFDVEVMGDEVTWTYADDLSSAILTYVYVGHLEDPTQMPLDVAATLASHGITPEEYPDILAADPFAGGSTYVDPERYVPLPFTFPYQPPYGPDDMTPALTFTVTDETIDTTTATATRDYSVQIGVSGPLSAEKIFSGSAKFTYTDSASQSTSDGTSESASLTVRGPSFGYTGPTNMAVYQDLLYKTFLFVPFTGSPTFTGTVNLDGRAFQAVEVVAIDERGNRFATITDANGMFQIFGRTAGRVELLVEGRTFEVQDPTRPMRILLTR